MHVGEIIKVFRERNGITQAQLGEGICTTTHVSKIENGKTAYSPEIITLFQNVCKLMSIKKWKPFKTLKNNCITGTMLLL